MRRRPILWVLCVVLLVGTASGSTLAKSIDATGSRSVSQISFAHRLAPGRELASPGAVLFGNRAVGSRRASSRPGSAEAFPFRMRASGMLSSISVFIDRHNAASVMMAGLYSNDHGHPGRRLASGKVASTKAGKWNKVFVRPTSIASGRTYWVGLLGERGRLYVRGRSSGGCVSEKFRRGGLAGLPERWRSGGHSSTCSVSAFGQGHRVQRTSGSPNRPPGTGTSGNPGSPGSSGPPGGTGSSSPVPCGLTHAAGADGTNSCWATHTGVTGATGYSEAQIEAGAPGFTHITHSITITQPGTVIDHEWISGCVAINSGANNVTIKDTLITAGSASCQSDTHNTALSAVNAGQDGNGMSAATGLLIEDTTVDGQNAPGDTYGVDFVHGSCIRCNVLGFSKGFWTGVNSAAAPTSYQDDYVHDMNANDQCAHMNGWFLAGSAYVTVEHSYSMMDGGGDNCVTGAISIQPGPPTPNNITIDRSYAEGDDGADVNGGCGGPNIVFTDNALSNNNGYSGQLTVTYYEDGPGNIWTGNYVPETGKPFGDPSPSTC